jgi:nitrogen fixation NifU-like protein
MSEDSAELHQAVLDEHRRRPRNRGPLPRANRVATRENPSCGDVCTLRLRVEDERIAEVAFTGAGCALSQASASLATVHLAGRTTDEARAIIREIERLVRDGGTHGAAPSQAPEAAALGLVSGNPARHTCALLAWHAASAALETPMTGSPSS